MSGLPETWLVATGMDLFALVRGVSYDKSSIRTESAEGFVPILRANNIATGLLNRDELVFAPDRFVSDQQLLSVGDIVIASSSGSKTVVGKAAMVSEGFGRASFGAFCTVARPRLPELRPWLRHYFSTRAYRDFVEQVALGININNLRGGDLGAVPIPVPPLAEQRRIVAKLDALTARTARARADLDRIPLLADRFRTASVRNLIAEAGSRAGAVPAGTLFHWASGKFLPKSKQRPGPIPVFGGNGVNGRHDEATTDFSTLVVGRVGAQCGNVHVTGEPAWITDNAIFAKRVDPNIDLQFALYVFQSANLIQSAGGTGQPYVNQDVLNEVQFPAIPLQEQQASARRIRTAFAEIDRLVTEAAAARRLLDRLDQAVLAKAFRGELVPQDPADEPASVLLDRIRAERAAAPKARRGRKPALA